jgi:hypothetical protein
MAIKHAKATHYKENIETKTKKLDDKSVTNEQKKVIQQDLDKLKEKHKNHVKAVEKDFDEQIKAAPKEVREKLEKEAFKSKYVAKEANSGATEGSDANIEAPRANNNTETPVVNNNLRATKEDAIKSNKLTVQKHIDAKYFENFCQDTEKPLVNNNTKETERTDDNTNYYKEEGVDKAKNECVTDINKLFREMNKVGKFLAAKKADQNLIVQTAQKEDSNFFYKYLYSFFIDNSKDNAKSTSLDISDTQVMRDKITNEIDKLSKNCTEKKYICELEIINKLWIDVKKMQSLNNPTGTQKSELNKKIISYEQEFNDCGDELNLDNYQ